MNVLKVQLAAYQLKQQQKKKKEAKYVHFAEFH